METYDCVIVGTGPAGLGAAFHLSDNRPDMRILMIDKESMSTGGLRNDCKMNFTFPIGFPTEYWQKDSADALIEMSQRYLPANILATRNIDVYQMRAQRLEVELLEIRQSHLGTDGGILLIRELMEKLRERNIDVSLKESMIEIREQDARIVTDRREIGYRKLIIAPGRKGFRFLQEFMDKLGIGYVDNVVDIGIRIETREEYYPIVRDYYDPKFLFPDKVRTFCTNSGKAYVVKERYKSGAGESYYSVNGHSFSNRGRKN